MAVVAVVAVVTVVAVVAVVALLLLLLLLLLLMLLMLLLLLLLLPSVAIGCQGVPFLLVTCLVQCNVQCYTYMLPLLLLLLLLLLLPLLLLLLLLMLLLLSLITNGNKPVLVARSDHFKISKPSGAFGCYCCCHFAVVACSSYQVVWLNASAHAVQKLSVEFLLPRRFLLPACSSTFSAKSSS